MTPDYPTRVDAYLNDEEKELLPNHEQLFDVLERLLTDLETIRTRLDALER